MSLELEKALDLVQTEPWPVDIEEQIEALMEMAPKDESEMFGDLFSAIMVVKGPDESMLDE